MQVKKRGWKGKPEDFVKPVPPVGILKPEPPGGMNLD
jgi:hypothetical protein